MVTALNVGNNILKRAFDSNIDITPMKLQKLIYILYKEYLQSSHTPLFNERFEVWKYGPVVRSVYDEFRRFGSNKIDSYAKEFDGSVYICNESTSPIFRRALDKVWGKYKDIDGIRLSEMTHKSGTAWYKASKAGRRFMTDLDIGAEGEFIE